MVTSVAPARPRPDGRPPGPFTRWPRAMDAAVGALVFALEILGMLSRMADEADAFRASMLGDIDPAAYVLVAVGGVALLWRRSHPVTVLIIALAASLVWDLMGLAGGLSLAIIISLFGVGRLVEEHRISVAVVVIAVVIGVADDLIEGEPAGTVGLSIALVLAAWYVGRRFRARRDYLALLEERATFQERERMAAAERAVIEERTRIARELHDVVAHRVSMITVQAGAAQTVAATDPDKAMRAMEAVEHAGREALDELRQVLGVLRSDIDREGLVPIHGLSELPDLVAEMRAAGMDVTLMSNDTPDHVPARVNLASYRIVQEALTNVLKHAGPKPVAEVRVFTHDDLLSIEVNDTGSGDSVLPGAGQGLVGMRERATLLGGTLEAGPRLGGGFRVVAQLPIERSAR